MHLLLPIIFGLAQAGPVLQDKKDIEAPRRAISIGEALAASRRSGWSWDAQADLGLRILPNRLRNKQPRRGWPFKAFDWGKRDPAIAFAGRLSAGGLLLAEPWVLTLGASGSFGGLGTASIGIIGEVTHLWTGLWGQFEPAWTFGRGVRFAVAAGYSVFGVEYRAAPRDDVHAVLLKIRIPLGLIYFVKTHF